MFLFTNISGQIERHQKDGTKEVTYPNATVRTCFPDGSEEWVFQDGLVVKVDSQLGEKVLLLPNGQREVHTKEHMVRHSILEFAACHFHYIMNVLSSLLLLIICKINLKCPFITCHIHCVICSC